MNGQCSGGARLLIADDDTFSRSATETLATAWGFTVTAVADGDAAWRVLQEDDAPKLALLDWMMPGLDGLTVCQRAKQRFPESPPYLILVTGLSTEADLVTGLSSGADDYVRKPVSPGELQARLHAGLRVVKLQEGLSQRVRDLQEAMGRVKQLHGLLPICSYCKKIRDDHNYWRRVEEYISAHSDTKFSHGICPDCFESLVQPKLRELTYANDSLAECSEATGAVSARDPEQAVAALGPTAGSEPVPAGRGECRGEPRYLCNRGTPFRSRKTWGTATIRDVSIGGVRLELPCEVAPGSELILELFNGESNCWHLKTLLIVHTLQASPNRWIAGTAFIDHLSADQVRQILKMSA